jgi:glycosyltransferase involved in cell wall biosynthesis
MKRRILFALPGLHRVSRGAEAAFENVARVLAGYPDMEVTLLGSGQPREGDPYRFIHAPLIPRERFERWPKVPPLRSDYRWEELTFLPGLLRRMKPADYDVAVTCSFPFVHWALRGLRRGGRPRTVFVTQNGDWPARRLNAEYRTFACDGLVCTNPEYFERNRATWRCALIPNGMDASRFAPGEPERAAFGLPEGVPLVLMVSALIPSKFVLEGVRAVADLPGAHLVVAGDGPLRGEVDALVAERMPGRFKRLTTTMDRMPALYRSADAFLHLSRDEAFGNVYVEALATGLPVVAHDYPVARWILGGAGSLVASQDLTAVTGALREALASRPDRAGLHAAAAERFDWKVVAGLYADFLREVAES